MEDYKLADFVEERILKIDWQADPWESLVMQFKNKLLDNMFINVKKFNDLYGEILEDYEEERE
jgi:hypothetical protein